MRNARTSLRSINCHLAVAAVLAFGLLGGLGGWAATSELAGAVIAPGVLEVESNVKKVQHPVGGVVSELGVKDGDFVHAGDVVAKLDDTQTKANLEIIIKQLDELNARKARLDAEKNGDASIQFPDELLARRDDADVSTLLAGERKLFESRREAREGQKSQLSERVNQLEKEIEGLQEQLDAKDQEIALIYDELKGVKDLFQKNLVPITRVTSLERDAARLEGERGQLVATTAETKAKIAEIQLQVIQIDQDLRSEVGKELADIRAKLAELGERKIAAEDQLKRIEIRAPQDGYVHQLTVHTVGGVVGAGETIMLIVPNADALIVEAKVAPKDIDELHVGQAAVLRFSAFDLRTTPELNGHVAEIAADVTQDQHTGQSFYSVRVSITPSELQRLGGLKLIPGMPVEAFIRTTSRTALSYLTKPLMDQAARTFRES
jgi:HlyD family secretion protein